MAGRSYKIVNGRKEFAPTELQLKRMANAELLNAKDIRGLSRNELIDNPELRKALMDYIKQKYTPEQLLEMLKKGLADDYDFAVMMAIRAYLDEKNGLKISEMFDKNSKWNIEKLIEEFHLKPIEYMAVYDRNNRFIGYSFGSDRQVSGHYLAGMMANGTVVHNHPIDKLTKLGGGLSIFQIGEDGKTYAGDILTFRNHALKEMIASGREGTYSLTRNKNVKISLKEIKTLQTEFKAASDEIFDKFLLRKKKGPRSPEYARAYAIEHHRIISSWAQKKGLSYTFKPRKGFEDLLDPSSITKPIPPL